MSLVSDASGIAQVLFYQEQLKYLPCASCFIIFLTFMIPTLF